MKDVFAIIWGFICLCFVSLGIWGWVWNIVKLVQSDFIISSGMSIGRVIGIFVAPVGAILGFM